MNLSIFKDFNKVPIIFGGAAISGEGAGYGMGDIDEIESQKLLEYLFERGIRVYDSAPIYGFGLSEKRIGNTFKHIREDVFYVSKSGVSWHENKRVNMTNCPKETQKMLEDSLRRFSTDYIDLYMIHWPDEKVDIRRPLEVLKKAQDQGKIKYIGLCNTNEEDFKKSQEVCSVKVVQSEYNYFSHEVKKLFPMFEKNDVEFMSWGTFDKGIITGRVTKDRTFDKSDCRSWAPWWNKKEVIKKIETMEKVFKILEKENIDPVSFALSYNLNSYEKMFPICGMKNIDSVDSVLEAYEARPDSGLFKSVLKSIENEL